ncbi:MAG: hypothetical protein QXJ75_04060 [Candidatus Bathyarchaeia archaeon]
MEIKEIRVRDRVGIRGLKNKGAIEISEDEAGNFVIIVGRRIERREMLTLPESMWRTDCSREELVKAVESFLTNQILAD